MHVLLSQTTARCSEMCCFTGSAIVIALELSYSNQPTFQLLAQALELLSNHTALLFLLLYDSSPVVRL